MKTAGIAIDDWKLIIFKKHLERAGFLFTKHADLTVGTLILKVGYEKLHTLRAVVEEAEKECAKRK